MPAYQELSQRLIDEKAEARRRLDALAAAAGAIDEAVIDNLNIPPEKSGYSLDSGEFVFKGHASAVAQRQMNLRIHFDDLEGNELHVCEVQIVLKHDGRSIEAIIEGETGTFMVVKGGPGLQGIAQVIEQRMRASMPWER